MLIFSNEAWESLLFPCELTSTC